MNGTMLKVKLWIHLAQMCQVPTNELNEHAMPLNCVVDSQNQWKGHLKEISVLQVPGNRRQGTFTL